MYKLSFFIFLLYSFVFSEITLSNNISIGINYPFTKSLIPALEIRLTFIRPVFFHRLSLEGMLTADYHAIVSDADISSTKSYSNGMLHGGIIYTIGKRINTSNLFVGLLLGIVVNRSLVLVDDLDTNYDIYSIKRGVYYGGPTLIFRKQFNKLSINIDDRLLIGHGHKFEGRLRDIKDEKTSFKILNTISLSIGIKIKDKSTDNKKI